MMFLIKQMERNGGSPKLWLEVWSRAKGIAEHDRAKHELRCLCKALQHAGSIDQLNLATLSCMETLSRRIQSIVDARELYNARNRIKEPGQTGQLPVVAEAAEAVADGNLPAGAPGGRKRGGGRGRRRPNELAAGQKMLAALHARFFLCH